MTNNKIERRLIGSPFDGYFHIPDDPVGIIATKRYKRHLWPFPLGAFEASTLENLPILIPIDDVSEEANHSHDDNDDNRCLKCQNHKR